MQRCISVLFALIIAAFLCSSPVQAQMFSSASFTNTTTAVAASSQTVTLAAPASSITVLVSGGTSDIYVNFAGGAATTSHFKIPAGSAFTYNTTTGQTVSEFTWIGSGTSGTVSVFAHP